MAHSLDLVKFYLDFAGEALDELCEGYIAEWGPALQVVKEFQEKEVGCAVHARAQRVGCDYNVGNF